MTVTKKIAALALALVFALGLVLPTAALADGEILTLESSSSTITIKEDGTSSKIALNATLIGATNDTVVWSTSNAAVKLSKTETNGSHSVELEGVLPGKATVTAAVKDNPSVTVSCNVVVKQVIRLKVTDAQPGTLEAGSGDNGYVRLSVQPENYSDYYDIIWASSNEDAVKVSGSGLSADYAVGSKIGSVNITATVRPKSGYSDVFEGNTVTIPVTVKSNKPYLTMSKDPSSTIKEHGYPGTVEVVLHNDNAYYGRGGAVEWSVSDTSVLSFSGDKYLSGGEATGTFKTKRNGTCTITATMKGSDGSTISESIKITVDKKLPILELDGQSHMNAGNRSLTLIARLDDNNTGTYAGNERIRWEVSHPDHISIVSYDSRLSNYRAEITIRSRYNIDKARVYVYMADNADINHYHTVYVTGLSYLPQTGQDTTVLYVVGALCASMFLTAGALYARRKRNENV